MRMVFQNGFLLRPDGPGLGITLNDEIEEKYRFDESDVYSCKTLDFEKPSENYWERN